MLAVAVSFNALFLFKKPNGFISLFFLQQLHDCWIKDFFFFFFVAMQFEPFGGTQEC